MRRKDEDEGEEWQMKSWRQKTWEQWEIKCQELCWQVNLSLTL